MAKRHAAPEIPACYAMVHRGLEDVAADEIERDLGGEVKKSGRGLVAFRVPQITPDILKLRTTEDVFLLAWGTSDLSFRAADLERITNWTRRVHWDEYLKIHHAIRPKPKGKPTWWLVTQMTGEHAYRRVDARKAMARGLEGAFPASWKTSEENASIEVWLTIHGEQAVCGLRLSDRTMRHRTYKGEHVPASLRPTIAAAMVRLAGASPGQVVLDPMCGAGTILAEQVELARQRGAGRITIWGGDIDPNAVRAASANLRKFSPDLLVHWDARRLPIPDASVDRIICNPPFGKQMSTPEEIAPLYRKAIAEWDRVLKPGGRAVLLVADPQPLLEAIGKAGWSPQKQYRVQVLGQQALMGVWRKREESV